MNSESHRYDDRSIDRSVDVSITMAITDVSNGLVTDTHFLSQLLLDYRTQFGNHSAGKVAYKFAIVVLYLKREGGKRVKAALAKGLTGIQLQINMVL